MATQVVDLELERLSKHLASMRARLLACLTANGSGVLGDGVKIHGPLDPALRLPNTLSIGVPGLEARVLLETVRKCYDFFLISARRAGFRL